jgi:citrate lyase subunit beta / citryl-CoA lyase
LSGVCLAKTGEADNVKRLDWKLEELERRRGLKVGSIAIQLLIETAKGMVNAYASATASKRVNSLIFGAVDYTKDMRVKLTSEAVEQLYGRFYTAVAARAAGCVAIDCPFVDFKNVEAFEASVLQGRQMGYEGRMLIHPSQIEPAHRLYMPSADDIEWATGIVKIFEEEGIAKGAAAVSFKGKMVDTPVYENARQILATMKEISEMEAMRKR